jgi:hypothetical protein
MYGLVVIRLSIKVYNPAAAGSTLDSLVISAWHTSAAIKVYNPADVPDSEGPAMRRMTPGVEWTMGPCSRGRMPG